MSIPITQYNGKPATVHDLAPLAFAGFAHFTAMQVRNRSVRGLDLHLQRLRTASDQLFGHHLPDEVIRDHLATALDDATPDVSLTCFLTSHPGEFRPADDQVGIDVLIKVTDSAVPPPGPLALDVVRHERHLPHVKHVGEVAKTLYLRDSNARGFDDAAFEDRAGRLSEATIWNLAFWDGDCVLWPRADVLPGVTMQILTRQLKSRGVPQQTRDICTSDLIGQFSAVVMNSWTPAIPLSYLGEQRLPVDPVFVQLLHQAYAAEPAIDL